MKKSIRNIAISFLFSVFFASLIYADSSYVVKKGDTLYSISRKYEITVAELRAANNLSEKDILKEGAKLVIPSADLGNAAALSQEKSNAPQTSSKSKTMSYTVQKGDTLYGIARKNGLNLAELLNLNNIDTNITLKVGQTLLVPDNGSVKVSEAKEISTSTNVKVAEVKTAGSNTKINNIINVKGIQWPLSNPKVKSISGKISGVELSGLDGESVKVVREGTVMYTGVYRGFGEVVFIQSKTGQIYSYTGLNKVSCKKGEYVVSGDEIGNIGKGSDASMKFMVFQNGNPIDPVKAPRG